MRLGVRRVVLHVLPIVFIFIFAVVQSTYTAYILHEKYRAEMKETDGTQSITENISIDSQGKIRVENTATIHFGREPQSPLISTNAISYLYNDDYHHPSVEEATLTCDGALVASAPQDAFNNQPPPNGERDELDPAQNSFFYTFPVELTNQTCETKFVYSIGGAYNNNILETYKDFTVFGYNLPAMEIGTDVPTQSIDIHIHLPVPEGEKILLNRNTTVVPDYPLTQKGKLQYKTSVDGDTVHIHITHLERTGNYSPSLSLLYPSEWDQQDYHFGYYAKKEENNSPHISYALEHLTGVTLTIFSIALIISVIFLIRYKKKHRPDFKDKYWRDVPDPDLHPVIVSRLWGWNTKAQQKKDFPVLIMNLASLGVITLVEEKDETGRTEYVIKKEKKDISSLTYLDKKVLEILFEEDKDRITFQELRKKLLKKDRRTKTKIFSIKRIIKKQTNDLATFTTFTMVGLWRYLCALVAITAAFLYLGTVIVETVTATRDIRGLYVMGPGHEVLLLSTVIFTALALGDRIFVKEGLEERCGFWTLTLFSWIASMYLASLPLDKDAWTINPDYAVLIAEIATLIFFTFSVFTLRPPNKVKEVVAKSKALKRWLEDFTLLDEKPPTDVKMWDEFMVYATAFDVADTTLATINNTLPGVASNSDFVSVVSWVKKDANNISPFVKIGEFFTESISPVPTKTSALS